MNRFKTYNIIYNKTQTMIIPIKCFTCGTVIGDKYAYFIKEVKQRKTRDNIKLDDTYLTVNNTTKTHAGHVMDELKLNKMCCRRHMLTHIDTD